MTGRHKHRTPEINTGSSQAPADRVLQRVIVGAEFSQEEKALAWQRKLIEKEEEKRGEKMTDKQKQEFIRQKRAELVDSIKRIEGEDI